MSGASSVPSSLSTKSEEAINPGVGKHLKEGESSHTPTMTALRQTDYRKTHTHKQSKPNQRQVFQLLPEVLLRQLPTIKRAQF